jgi:hypothetical protein
MSTNDKAITYSLPPADELRHRLGDALREVEMLRGLLRLAERADRYRERDAELACDQLRGDHAP